MDLNLTYISDLLSEDIEAAKKRMGEIEFLLYGDSNNSAVVEDRTEILDLKWEFEKINKNRIKSEEELAKIDSMR